MFSVSIRGNAGPNHYKWKGGKTKTKQGYVRVLDKTHHFSQSGGRVMEHRIVWEKHNNASLLPWSDVHHLNGIKDDNRPENLIAMMKAKHSSDNMRHKNSIINMQQKKVIKVRERQCVSCSSSNTYIHPSCGPTWHKYQNGFQCQKCYYKRIWEEKKKI